ncbi:MAG: IS21 family transposase [Thermosyntropha sp.]|nr:IS21 family transposase [Thermosyntropha sp.]
MDQYKLIRELYVIEGLSQRQIAKTLGISRNTVRRYCNGNNLPGERKNSKRKPSVVTPEIRAFIQDCLDEDKKEDVKKQKHTAKKIYDRLTEELGFTGGESTIRRVVHEMKEKMPKVFIPLSFSPGEAAQVDWGTAIAYIAGQKTEVNLFCMRLCSSCTPFVFAFPSQREEAFLEGHQRAFKFFGGVPRDIIYDNLKTAVKEGWGKTAREQNKFAKFRAHYVYNSRFCNPGEGHEKGLVEDLVGYSRRNFLVPLPRVENWEELNQLLIKRCNKYIEVHHVRGRELSVKEAFEQERQALTALPGRPYEAAKLAEGKVDYFSTVTFETNHYSVPVKWSGRTVTVRATSFEVQIYYRGELIASHERCYQKYKTRYQLEHYLPLIEMRPRSVFHAKPVKEARLPEELEIFSRKLNNPEKSMVRLLRLAIDYGYEKVADAIRKADANNQYSVDVVQFYLNETELKVIKINNMGPAVQTVDLKAYDILCTGGDRL